MASSLQEDLAARRQRVIRTAVVLGVIALAFYFGFIALSVIRGGS